MENREKMGWSRALLLLMAFCLAVSGAVVPVRAAESEGETIRVGFVDQNYLSYLDADGKRAGYEYEYLQEIAQYTGWNYEFVDFSMSNEDLTSALEQLESGEIDLMTTMTYSDALAQTYDYAAYSHGSVHTVLAVLDENTAINENNLFQHRTFRVAARSKAVTRMEELKQFCAMSNVEVDIILCESSEEQREALYSGKADALLELDVSLPQDMRIVAKFASRPYYFATTKGNSQFIGELNAALLNINGTDPSFSVSLYEKYFNKSGRNMSLTDEEQAFIRGTGLLRVGVFGPRPPIQTIDERNEEFWGISKEVFDYISAQTGLSFEFISMHGNEDLSAALEAGTVDLVSGFVYDYDMAESMGVAMSRPYLSSGVTYAVNAGTGENLTGKRLALSPGLDFHGDPTAQITYYASARECLDAVERGDADYAYSSSYVFQYITSQKAYRNLNLLPRGDEEQRICIGVRKPAEVTLLSILNKAIRSLSDDELHTMIYHNVAYQGKVTLASFISANPWLCLGIVILTAALLVLGLMYYYRTRFRLTRAAALESERYRQLSALTNEHIFEYDYSRDTVTLSERSAEDLGVPHTLERFMERAEENTERFSEEQWEFIRRVKEDQGGSLDMECELSSGEKRWFRITIKVIRSLDGEPQMAIGKLADIQSEREEMDRLEERARRDSLTGLYNAATVRRMVTAQLAEDDAGGALLILDIDFFKKINDVYGHLEGDRVLTSLARVLESTFRREDVLGRLGGDEFAVFMRNLRSRAAVEEKCRLLIERSKDIELPQGGQVTLSVGAELAEPGIAYDQLYQQADQALYQVKNGGRNGFLIRE